MNTKDVVTVFNIINLSFTSFQAENMCSVEINPDPEKGTYHMEDAGSEQSDQVKNANIRILLYGIMLSHTYI